MHRLHPLRVAAVLIAFALGAPAYAQPAGGPPLTLQDALALVRAGEIEDAKTEIALRRLAEI